MAKSGKKLGLQALLLEPVQRLPRYRLILEQLLLHTPSAHHDHQDLTKALILVEQVVKFVNEKVREYESFFELIEIEKSLVGYTDRLVSPGRILVKIGNLMKVCRKNHQMRRVFLFSDLILYASEGFEEGRYLFHKSISLEVCSVEDAPDLYGIKFAFKLVSSIKSFTLYACKSLFQFIHCLTKNDSATNEEKQEWLIAFQRTIDALQTSGLNLVPSMN